MRSFALATAVLTVATAAHAATPVFRDDFSDARSGWADDGRHADRALGFSTYTPDGHFQMTPTADGSIGVLPAPRQAATPDVRVAVDDFMYAGLGHGTSGLVCRMQDADNFYAFLVTGTPGWNIVRVSHGSPTVLARGPLPRGAVPGAVEGRLEATCIGDRLTFAFAGRTMGEARDATFATGRVGLMVLGERGAGTSAVFDDFVLAQVR